MENLITRNKTTTTTTTTTAFVDIGDPFPGATSVTTQNIKNLHCPYVYSLKCRLPVIMGIGVK